MQVGDPVQELQSSELYAYLLAIDGEYAQRITQFVAGVAPILATTSTYFPFYTRHDAHHGFRVTKRIAQIVLRGCVTPGTELSFGAAEVFLLISAAYSHDLGMTVFPGEEDALLSALRLSRDAGWQTSPTLQGHLRTNHSRRGGDFIHKNAEALGVPRNLVHPLDQMMKSHNLSLSDLERELRMPQAAQERVIDVRQLAIILCIADAIEFSDTRVVDGVLDAIRIAHGPAAMVSYQENMKHVCIGDGLGLDGHGRVVVSGTFNEPEVLALAHRTLDQMEEWIGGYCDIDRASQNHRLFIRPEPFSRNLVLRNARFERLGVRMSKKSVIELIASNAIWQTDKGAAVRELLQNAVEACRYRQYQSPPAQAYSPQISVVFDRVANTISVTDNGCGMSERVIMNNFLTVGSSRSKERGYADARYAPLARFGIGFWSVFTIAESASIETAPFEELDPTAGTNQRVEGVGFDVSLSDTKDYTVFDKRDLPCGTSVVLRLKEGFLIDDVYSAAKRQILCSLVPMQLIIDGVVFDVPHEVPPVSDAEVLGARQRLKDAPLQVQVFEWGGTTNDTEVAVGFAYRFHKGVAGFMADDNNALSLSLEGMHMRSVRTAVCGFQVPVRPKPHCFDLWRVGLFFANHRTPHGFEFSIDRRQLIENDEFRAFATDITFLIHEAFRAFLVQTGNDSAERKYELCRQSKLNGGEVLDTYTGSELREARDHFSDLLCFRLYEVSNGGHIETSPIRHVTLAELESLQGDVWFAQTGIVEAPAQPYGIHLQPQQLRTLAYACAAAAGQGRGRPAFVAEPGRETSMLFDAAPNGDTTVHSSRVPGGLLTAVVHRVSLDDLRFEPAEHCIMAEVQGIWAGAIYLRDFNALGNKPYLFLGRHRVLIKRGTALAEHLAHIANEGRVARLAELIADLQQDASGFTKEWLEPFLAGE
ncbi:HD domain-containing protein [Burkholderia diffusa]|uniref:HD domain-containing protein n=1 Tax=Burkholderia diffusa TaxID=488732 RepID=UPI0015827170|nr:ATP-binding protein [Burkholderia diffusa]